MCAVLIGGMDRLHRESLGLILKCLPDIAGIAEARGGKNDG